LLLATATDVINKKEKEKKKNKKKKSREIKKS
jgi:hypothetical protein